MFKRFRRQKQRTYNLIQIKAIYSTAQADIADDGITKWTEQLQNIQNQLKREEAEQTEPVVVHLLSLDKVNPKTLREGRVLTNGENLTLKVRRARTQLRANVGTTLAGLDTILTLPRDWTPENSDKICCDLMKNLITIGKKKSSGSICTEIRLAIQEYIMDLFTDIQENMEAVQTSDKPERYYHLKIHQISEICPFLADSLKVQCIQTGPMQALEWAGPEILKFDSKDNSEIDKVFIALTKLISWGVMDGATAASAIAHLSSEWYRPDLKDN